MCVCERKNIFSFHKLFLLTYRVIFSVTFQANIATERVNDEVISQFIVTIDLEKSHSPRNDSTRDLVGDKEPKIKPPSFQAPTKIARRSWKGPTSRIGRVAASSTGT